MKLNFRALGHGPPLIILHGLLGSLANWSPLASVFGTQFSVFILDLRNHGGSPHADRFDYEAMAADLADFMRDQNLTQTNLLGHSLGGKAAMRFAQLHPEAVRKLVVVDMSPRAYPPQHAELLEATLALDMKTFHRRDEIDTALAPAVPEKVMRQFLLKNVGRDATGAFYWKPNLRAIHANYPLLNAALPADGQFTGPTLFIRGGNSNYVTDADFTAACKLFPRAEMETIPGAGHWVHADAPGEFARHGLIFLTAA